MSKSYSSRSTGRGARSAPVPGGRVLRYRVRMKNDDKPNFLTCPAFPELEAPVQAKPVESQSPLQKAIPPVQQVASRTIPRLRSRQATHGPRKRTALWVSLVILVLLGILTGPALVALARAGVSAQSAKGALDRAVGHARDREYASAGASLGDAQSDLLSVKQALGCVGFWRDVPTVGTQIRALEDAAGAGDGCDRRDRAAGRGAPHVQRPYAGRETVHPRASRPRIAGHPRGAGEDFGRA